MSFSDCNIFSRRVKIRIWGGKVCHKPCSSGSKVSSSLKGGNIPTPWPWLATEMWGGGMKSATGEHETLRRSGRKQQHWGSFSACQWVALKGRREKRKHWRPKHCSEPDHNTQPGSPTLNEGQIKMILVHLSTEHGKGLTFQEHGFLVHIGKQFQWAALHA